MQAEGDFGGSAKRPRILVQKVVVLACQLAKALRERLSAPGRV
jgi:hypothetical protein